MQSTNIRWYFVLNAIVLSATPLRAAPMNSIPLSTALLNAILLEYKMNKIVNKFLLAGDKFMTDMHLKQPGFTYNACGPFAKNKEKIQKFKEKGDTNYIYKNERDKVCLQHGMIYGDFKDLARRAASDEDWRDETFDIAKDPKYDEYQRSLAAMVYKFYDKNSASSSVNTHINNKN